MVSGPVTFHVDVAEVHGGFVPPPAEVSGPVIASLDPGSSYLGLAIIQGILGVTHLTLAQTFDVGESVTENGKAHHVLNDASLDALADRIVALLLEFGVTSVFLEHVDSVHIAPTQANAASSIGTALIRTMMVGTTLRERLRAAGLQVTRVRASTWRARVGARGKRGESELELLPQVIAVSVVNWDEWQGDVDEHGRDAIGLAIYGTMPAIAPGSKMGRKSAKIDTKQEKADRLARGVVNKRNARQRAREAKGCHCPITDADRAHRDGCPIKAEQIANMKKPRGKYSKTLAKENAT